MLFGTPQFLGQVPLASRALGQLPFPSPTGFTSTIEETLRRFPVATTRSRVRQMPIAPVKVGPETCPPGTYRPVGATECVPLPKPPPPGASSQRFGPGIWSTAFGAGAAAAAATAPSAITLLGRRFKVQNLSGQAEDVAWFEANRIPIARQYAGQFVVVKDQAVVAAAPDFQGAYAAGIATFGTEPFLVKEAAERERPIREGAPT